MTRIPKGGRASWRGSAARQPARAAALLLALTACSERNPAPSLAGFVPVQLGSLKLQVPAAWPRLDDQGATAVWLVPGNGAGDGTLAVSAVGRGGAEAELKRWQETFAPEGLRAVPSTMRFPGRQAMEVLELHGTFLGASPDAPKRVPDWKTTVAAITLERGAWAVRIAGPAPTVDRSLTDFHTVLGQIRN